jgi:hypothetical protein
MKRTTPYSNHIYLFVGSVNIEAKLFVLQEWCNCHVIMDVGGHYLSWNNVVMQKPPAIYFDVISKQFVNFKFTQILA